MTVSMILSTVPTMPGTAMKLLITLNGRRKTTAIPIATSANSRRMSKRNTGTGGIPTASRTAVKQAASRFQRAQTNVAHRISEPLSKKFEENVTDDCRYRGDFKIGGGKNILECLS